MSVNGQIQTKYFQSPSTKVQYQKSTQNSVISLHIETKVKRKYQASRNHVAIFGGRGGHYRVITAREIVCAPLAPTVGASILSTLCYFNSTRLELLLQWT